MNDGWHDFSPLPKLSKKSVPTLRGVAETGPWTWHGWQTSIEDAMVESFTKSMQGQPPDRRRRRGDRRLPRHPRVPAEPLPRARRRALRGRRARPRGLPLAQGRLQHLPPRPRPSPTARSTSSASKTDRDVYKGYNPPSLRGLYDPAPYLHDGRARTLREALTGDHAPDLVTGLGELTEQELDDLIAYLETL